MKALQQICYKKRQVALAELTTEQLEKAVDEILGNKGYKNKALEIQAEIARYDPVGVIIENNKELARKGM
jgi:UDP:flavonoid glycosyltransferase YjiC (YdhE family)